MKNKGDYMIITVNKNIKSEEFLDLEHIINDKGLFLREIDSEHYLVSGDTYKFDDPNYIYRVFSDVDVDENFFFPKEEEELIVYYTDIGYSCKLKEE